jgi:hypothetical protein
MGMALATILTALTMSNQAFAQHLVTPTTLMYGKLGQTLAGQDRVPHVGQVTTGGMPVGSPK